ncbi:MAG: methyltransferase domain-containing protein [Candidatus Paceibacterota bacterium]
MISQEKFDKKFFNSGAYKNYRKILSAWVRPMARRISKTVGDRPSIKILDIGCGFGDLIAELQNKYRFEVSGIDYSSYAVRKADPSIRKRIKKGSILDSAFKKNGFDAVVCFDVIYYLSPKEVDKAIKNLVDASRKYIFFNSIYRHSFDASQRNNPDPLRNKVLSKKEYISIFSKNGAKLVKSFREKNGGETLVFKKVKK